MVVVMVMVVSMTFLRLLCHHLESEHLLLVTIKSNNEHVVVVVYCSREGAVYGYVEYDKIGRDVESKVAHLKYHVVYRHVAG